MSPDLTSHPDRLLAAVITLDEVLERRLFACALLDLPTSRLSALSGFLHSALGATPLVDSFDRCVDSPMSLWQEAEDVNLDHVRDFGADAPGWEAWRSAWQRYEQALTYVCLDVAAGVETDLTSRYVRRAPTSSRKAALAAEHRGGRHS
jgi:hypothetical protein